MKRLIVSAGVLIGICNAAMAQTALPSGGPGNIDEIIVTATRSPQRLDHIASSISVIDAAAIQSSQVAVVSDLLSQTAGVTYSRNGGVGGTTSIYIRGAESDQTVMLIDGVKLNDPSQPGSGFDFSNLLTGDINRVEILRGPQSTLWGSEAIGGVVNILTASPTKPFEGNIQVEGGTHDTAYVSGGLGGTADRLSWRVAGNYYSTRGISAFDQAFGGKEPDGYNNAGLTGRFSYDLTPNVQLDERIYYLKARNDFDGYPPPLYLFADTDEYGRTSEFVDYSAVNFNVLDGRFKNRIAFQYTDIDRNNYDPSLSVRKTFEGIGRNIRFEYQGTLDLAEGTQAIFGAEHEHSTITTDSPSPFNPSPTPLKAAADISSGYGKLQAQIIHGLTLTGGIRYDDHDTFGGRASVQAGAVWSFNNDATILRATFGQGFKAPALYQLFSAYGNTSLKPEEANGWDAGIEQHLWDGRITASATYFYRTSTNLIQFFSCGGGDPICVTHPFGYYANIADARASGIEIQTSATIMKGLTASANYTFTDSTNRSPGSATFGNDLPRRPRNAANASLTYVWPVGLTTAVAARYAGRNYNDAANTIVLNGYVLIDLRASYPINDKIEVYGRVENLGNKYYETTYQYGSLGRVAYGGFRARF